MKTASGELVPPEETKPQRKGWPLSLWLLLIAAVLIAHVVLLCIFGTRKAVAPRAVTNVPELELAHGPGEWLTLDNPTLFALPNREGFAGPAWLEPPHLEFQWPEWTIEQPRWLQLPAGELGAVFNRFMQTNQFATFRFNLRPPPQLTVPAVPRAPVFAQTSTLRVEGDLAKRPLLTSMKLPSWPTNYLVAPSRVQVLVNPAGRVDSTVLLPPRNPDEVQDALADQYAVEFARAARFAPASAWTVGQLIFDWRTIAPAATNVPPVQ